LFVRVNFEGIIFEFGDIIRMRVYIILKFHNWILNNNNLFLNMIKIKLIRIKYYHLINGGRNTN